MLKLSEPALAQNEIHYLIYSAKLSWKESYKVYRRVYRKLDDLT
jgi:hypothetical protein